MPLKVNLEKAKNIFQKNIQSSINYEIQKIDKEIIEEDNERLIELKEYYQNYSVDVSEVKNVYELDSLWPDTLPFKSPDNLFQKTVDTRKYKTLNEIAGCQLVSGPFEKTRVLSAFNIPFILNRSSWNFLFVPQSEIVNKDKNYNYFYGWNEIDQTLTYSIMPTEAYAFDKTEDMYKLNYTNKRILLQKSDNSVIIIIPVNLKIELEELIAKLSYIPEKKEWAYSEVFNLDELPSEKYRDAWELIGLESNFYDKD